MNTTLTPPKQPWLIVARREMMVKLTDKAFWIGTITPILVMVIAFAASYYLGGVGEATKVATNDPDGTAIVELAKEQGGNYELVDADPEQAVMDEDATVGLRPAEAGWEVIVDGSQEGVPGIQEAITAYVVAQNAESQGVDLQQLNAGAQAQVVDLAADSDQPGGIGKQTLASIVGMIFSILFFISAMTYGLQIAQSVIEEKENRIVEILMAAIPVRQLLTGKVVGNSVMALGQIVVLVAVAMIGALQTPFAPVLPAIASSVGWFVVFFLFGFAALACLWAACGALATKVSDLNSVSTPLMMILMIAYVAGFSATGAAAKIMSYIPIMSSMVMPRQLLLGDATWIDAVIALALVTVFMAVAIWFGEKIYRRGVMNTSGTLKWRQALKAEK